MNSIPKSTDISTLVKASIEAIADINNTLIENKLDASTIKNLSNSFKPLSQLMTNIGKFAESISKIMESKSFGILSNVKLHIKLKQLSKTIKIIVKEIFGSITLLNPKTFAKAKGLAEVIGLVEKISALGGALQKSAVLLLNPIIWISLKLTKLFIKVLVKTITKSIDSKDFKNLLTMRGKYALLEGVIDDLIGCILKYTLASALMTLLLPVILITTPLFILGMFVMITGLKFVGKLSGKAILAVLKISLLATALVLVCGALMLASLAIMLVDWKTILLFPLMLIMLGIEFVAMGLLLSIAAPLALLGLGAIILLSVPLLIAAACLAGAAALLNSIDSENIGATVRDKMVNPMIDIVKAILDVNIVEFTLATIQAGEMALISGALLLMALNLKGISSLNIVSEIDEKTGKPIKYEQFGEADFTGAVTNSSKIIEGLLGIARVINEANIVEITLAMIKAAEMVPISLSVWCIAGVIKNIAAMKIATGYDEKGNATGYDIFNETDIQLAVDNTAKIIEGLLGIAAKIDDNASILALAKAGVKATEMLGISLAVAGIARVISNVASMRIPTEFDKNGNPLKYETISPDQMTAATDNVAYIMTTLLTAMTNPELVARIDDMSGRATKKVKNIMDSANGLYLIINSIKDVAEMQKKINLVNSARNITNILKAYCEGIANIFGDSKSLASTGLEILTDIGDDSEDIDKGITSVGNMINEINKLSSIKETPLSKNSESFIKLLNNTKTIDERKITSITDMFKQMTAFSESVKGDFDALAEVLNDKLVDILSKLHNTLSDISVNVNTNQNTTTVSATPPAEQKTIAEQKADNQSKLQESLNDIQDLLYQLQAEGIKIKQTAW